MSGSGTKPADWDGSKYARVAAPQRDWSDAVLSRLDLRGTETVMDAGCGSGYFYHSLRKRSIPVEYFGIDATACFIDLGQQHLPALRCVLPLRHDGG